MKIHLFKVSTFLEKFTELADRPQPEPVRLFLKFEKADISDIRKLASLTLPPFVQELSLDSLGDEILKILASGPFFEEVRDLTLANSEITGAGLQALAKCSLNRLHYLHLVFNPSLRDQGALVLAGLENLPNLRLLVMIKCGLTVEGVGTLLASNNFPHLAALDCSGASIIVDGPSLWGAEAQPSGGLRFLAFDYQIISGSKALGRVLFLPRLKSLEILDLKGHDLGLEGLKYLGEAALPALTKLTFGDNFYPLAENSNSDLAIKSQKTDPGEDFWQGSWESFSYSLTELDFSDCLLSPSFFKHLHLNNPRLFQKALKLSFTSCNIDEMHMSYLRLLPKPNLRSLKIWNNKVGDEGLGWLSQDDSLRKLEELILRGNQIGDRGVEALVSSPVAVHLSRLDLSWNQVGDAGAAAIASSPYLANLTKLDLSNNRITPAGVEALIASQGLPRLARLGLHENQGVMQDVPNPEGFDPDRPDRGIPLRFNQEEASELKARFPQHPQIS